MAHQYLRGQEYYSTTTLQEIEEIVGNVRMSNRQTIPSLISSYFKERLILTYGTEQAYTKVFDDWFKEVKKSCEQLGFGYTVRYKVGQEGSYHHMGIPISSYDICKHKQTEDLSMIAHVLGYTILVDDIPELHRWGN